MEQSSAGKSKKSPYFDRCWKKREGLDEILNFASYIVCSAKFPQVSCWIAKEQVHNCIILPKTSAEEVAAAMEPGMSAAGERCAGRGFPQRGAWTNPAWPDPPRAASWYGLQSCCNVFILVPFYTTIILCWSICDFALWLVRHCFFIEKLC